MHSSLHLTMILNYSMYKIHLPVHILLAAVQRYPVSQVQKKPSSGADISTHELALACAMLLQGLDAQLLISAAEGAGEYGRRQKQYTVLWR